MKVYRNSSCKTNHLTSGLVLKRTVHICSQILQNSDVFINNYQIPIRVTRWVNLCNNVRHILVFNLLGEERKECNKQAIAIPCHKQYGRVKYRLLWQQLRGAQPRMATDGERLEVQARFPRQLPARRKRRITQRDPHFLPVNLQIKANGLHLDLKC